MTAPSAWTIQTVMSVAQQLRARMLDDGTLDADSADLLEALGDTGADVDTLITRLVRAIGEADGNADAAEERMRALGARMARFRRQREEYRATLFAILDAMGLAKVRHAEYTIAITQPKPGVVITDLAALPDDFVRITKAPDKTAIGAALASGAVVPGAEMANGLPTITIRNK